MKDGGTKDGVTCLAGTGPWVLSEHKDQQYALFSRNEGYWGDKPIVPTVRWNVVPDTQTMLMALEKGEIDLVFGADGDQLTGDAFKKLTDEKRLNTAVGEPIASRAILVNSKRPITKDVRVREALAYAFNRQAVVDGILNGTEAAAMTLFAKSVPYCDVPLRSAAMIRRRPSRFLMRRAGRPVSAASARRTAQRLVLDFYFNSNNAQEKDVAEAVQGRPAQDRRRASRDRRGEAGLPRPPAHGRIRPAVLALLGGAPYDPQSYLSSWRIPAHGDYQSQIGLANKAHIDATITAPHDRGRRDKAPPWFACSRAYHGCSGLHPVSYSRTKAVYSNRIKDVSFAVTQYEIPFGR